MKKVLSLILAVTMLFGAAAMVSAQDKTYLERAYDGEFKGKIVTLDGPFIDNDQVLFEASIKDFEEKTYEIINDGRHTPYFNLQNPSQIAAYPSFEIFGNGTITVQVGGQVVTITDVDGWIMVEGGESLVCYDNDGSALNRMSLYPADDVGFPSIAGNEIAYIMQTGADRIIVMPNWRYL